MTKQKIAVDQKFILNSSYEKYKYLTEYMVHGQDGNSGISVSFLCIFLHLLMIQQYILGGSAVMMSYNGYDIEAKITDKIDRSNIQFRIGNFMNDEIN